MENQIREPQSRDPSRELSRPSPTEPTELIGQIHSLQGFQQFFRKRLLEIHVDRFHTPQPYVTIMNAIEQLAERQERTEFLLNHGIRPSLSRMAGMLELLDPDPPAASAAYDWGIDEGRASSLHAPFTRRWNENVSQTIEITSNLLNEYDDLPSRLAQHVALMEHIKDLIELARSHGNKHLARAALTISDALHSVYAEDLTKEQVKSIGDVTQQLLDDTMDATRNIDRKLRFVGFETIPSDTVQKSIA